MCIPWDLLDWENKACIGLGECLQGGEASLCVLIAFLGFSLHLVFHLNLPYFLVSSSLCLFEKMKKIHYLYLFSVEVQKGTCHIARNEICSCSFSRKFLIRFSCYFQILYEHSYFCFCAASYPWLKSFSPARKTLFILPCLLQVLPLYDASLSRCSMSSSQIFGMFLPIKI